MTKVFHNKKILLGVTGGIAAFKSADLTHKLRHAGAEVKVVMTPGACEFITPLTFQALSGNTVYTEIFDSESQTGMEHIDLARWADIILIAPATANCVAKLAQGLADDLLSTICLATNKPIFVAPAMNQQMWNNSITQANIASLIHHSFQILGPAEGVQACGDVGPGRMLEVEDILKLLAGFFEAQGLLKGQKVLITAGPTREQIDPVRYISNNSSGKMGYALAQAAANAGAVVTVISGPTSIPRPSNVSFIDVTTAEEMYRKVGEQIGNQTIFISAAAVADYRPVDSKDFKIKKVDKSLSLDLERTEDILGYVASLPDAPITIGFAAETNDLIENATQKLLSKKIDAIIANAVGSNQGFDRDDNEATMIFKDGISLVFPLMRKSELADKIIMSIADVFKTSLS